MKERIKGVFTKKKIFHFLKMALFVVALSLILLSLLGTVAHATGLVDDTINAENLYSKYPLSNYQLDFFVDNSWSWLPWNWLDGIGKSVQYGLYCITNFVWTISLYLSNATGYVVQEASITIAHICKLCFFCKRIKRSNATIHTKYGTRQYRTICPISL